MSVINCASSTGWVFYLMVVVTLVVIILLSRWGTCFILWSCLAQRSHEETGLAGHDEVLGLSCVIVMDLWSVLQREATAKLLRACQPTGSPLCVQLKQHLQVNTNGQSTLLFFFFPPSFIGPGSYYVDTIAMWNLRLLQSLKWYLKKEKKLRWNCLGLTLIHLRHAKGIPQQSHRVFSKQSVIDKLILCGFARERVGEGITSSSQNPIEVWMRG